MIKETDTTYTTNLSEYLLIYRNRTNPIKLLIHFRIIAVESSGLKMRRLESFKVLLCLGLRQIEQKVVVRTIRRHLRPILVCT